MSKTFFEPLEDRRMLSLVVDVRLPGGGKTATVSKVGDVVNLEIWATATGSNATGSDEGLQIVVGSLLSTNVSGGAANGTLAAQLTSEFRAPGATNGNQADLDGDGDLDVGSNNDSDATGFIFARSDSPVTDGTVSGASQSWEIATATFTVTSLGNTSGATDIGWRIRNAINGALWREDGTAALKNGASGYSAGSPVVIKTTTNGTGGGGSTASISGTVFNDGNKDGALDAGDTVLSARKMFIDANNNGKLDSGEKTATSNASGVYSFTGLAAGTYIVRRSDTPAGYTTTDPAAGFASVTLASGQAVTGINFGAVQGTVTANKGSISGTVFNDGNKDGTFDAGDTALASRKIYIDANNNGKLDSGEVSTTSNAGGVYTFSNLPAGTYIIRRADTPAGYTTTTPQGGFASVNLASSQAVTGINFGAVQGTVSTNKGSISGTLFNDTNKDGAFDAGDSALSARKAYIDANNNGKLDAGEVTATSNASGVYTFSNLAAGTYIIRRGDTPAGYSYTEPASGFYSITLAAGQVVSGKNIGVVQGTVNTNKGSISGTVFNDTNKDAKNDAGDSVLSARKVYIDANNNGKLDAGEVSTTTNASGVYTFAGLAAGTYIIRRADTPAGYSYTVPASGFYSIALSAGQVVTGKDIGVVIK